MNLDDDCLLHVLKRCTPTTVCCVSRTDKWTKSLIDKHTVILPRIHKDILIVLDIPKNLVTWFLAEPGRVHESRPFQEATRDRPLLDEFERGIVADGDESLVECVLSQPASAHNESKTKSSNDSHMSIAEVLHRKRYVAIDEAFFVYRCCPTTSISDCDILPAEKALRDIETLPIKQFTGVTDECTYLVYLRGLRPAELRQFWKLCKGYFDNFWSDLYEDYSFMRQYMLNSRLDFRLGFWNAALCHIGRLFEIVLEEAFARKVKLARTHLRYLEDEGFVLETDLRKKLARFIFLVLDSFHQGFVNPDLPCEHDLNQDKINFCKKNVYRVIVFYLNDSETIIKVSCYPIGLSICLYQCKLLWAKYVNEYYTKMQK